MNDLKGPADDLGPTVRDLGDLAPDLEALFRDLPPLIQASEQGPARAGARARRRSSRCSRRCTRSSSELNPILSYFNYHQVTIASFLSNGASNLNAKPGGERAQTQIAIIDPRSFDKHYTQPRLRARQRLPGAERLQAGLAGRRRAGELRLRARGRRAAATPRTHWTRRRR